MSLGFLTESALLPSKATKITNVDASSLVDLKALVYKKEQQQQERAKEGRSTSAAGSKFDLRQFRGEGAARRREDVAERDKKDPFKRANKGVEERNERDAEEAKGKKRKAKNMLEAKAKLYNKIARGELSGAESGTFLVDFSSKKDDDLNRLTAEEDEKEEAERSGADDDDDGGDDSDDYGDADGGRGGGSDGEYGRGRHSDADGRRRDEESRGAGRKRGRQDDALEKSSPLSSFFADVGKADGDDVEIVDEFGRSRRVKRGSKEYKDWRKAKRERKQQEADEKEAERRRRLAVASRYSDGKNAWGLASSGVLGASARESEVTGPYAWGNGRDRQTEADHVPAAVSKSVMDMLEQMADKAAAATAGAGGAGGVVGAGRVTSKWEMTLKDEEKGYLKEIREETRHSKDVKLERQKKVEERRQLIKMKQEERLKKGKGGKDA